MPSRGRNRRARPGATPVTGPFADVQALVKRIPRGKVATYGQLSAWVDGRLTPIGVSWALRAGGLDLPWHRVVSSSGRLSTEREHPGEQRARLEAEGVQFRDGAIDLLRYGWQGPRRRGADRP
jgi:methylated-DNA-protein-cysteine methyltransferase-like protein